MREVAICSHLFTKACHLSWGLLLVVFWHSSFVLMVKSRCPSIDLATEPLACKAPWPARPTPQMMRWHCASILRSPLLFAERHTSLCLHIRARGKVIKTATLCNTLRSCRQLWLLALNSREPTPQLHFSLKPGNRHRGRKPAAVRLTISV